MCIIENTGPEHRKKVIKTIFYLFFDVGAGNLSTQVIADKVGITRLREILCINAS